MNRIIIFLSLIVLTSCFTERIELDLNEDNKTFVITGWVSNLDEPQYISLSQTVNYLGSVANDYVSGGQVTIDDGVETYMLEEGDEGRYYLPTNWQARIGNTYTLTVVQAGTEYKATHKMRPCPEIENLHYRVYVDDDSEPSDTVEYETLFDFQEIEGEGDAYYGIDYLKGSTAGDSLVNGSYTNDAFLDGEYFEEIILTEDDRLFLTGDTAVVEIYSIGEETANFLFDIESEIYRGGPFDPPPANIRSNITGGRVFGYFIVSDARRQEVVIR